MFGVSIQVKRQKPGQAAAALPTPKVLPLTKATSGKMDVAAAPAPTPAKIKLMSRPQVRASGCVALSLANIDTGAGAGSARSCCY